MSRLSTRTPLKIRSPRIVSWQHDPDAAQRGGGRQISLAILAMLRAGLEGGFRRRYAGAARRIGALFGAAQRLELTEKFRKQIAV